MTTREDTDICASRGCKVSLAGRAVIVDRDGRRYCKHHGDRLPPYLRKSRRTPKPITT